ncbi:hypothetical protein Y032_0008g28 [Ancylostoma ceylanicum]|uniref:RNA-directed DNA polymerase n=1 Tax=Ancylostoma ceylanicum TaxID=53326 RepID=A0A016VML0_9BILA|nr:hypothetical protein Y032_0008g28 [Ancylostoma ceylanicum]
MISLGGVEISRPDRSQGSATSFGALGVPSEIEKEALALIFAVQKFYRFVHGRHFTLKTDHKPPLAIFGSKKGEPVYSANRLQRSATTLLKFNSTVEYVNTKNFGQTDALSRLIAAQPSESDDYVIVAVDVDVDRNSPLWHYYYYSRDKLTTTNDCLLTANRIVIPKSLHCRVLASLHKAHQGQTRMKMPARSYVFQWPSLDADIESIVKNCTTCTMLAKNSVKAELYSRPKPTAPWTREHAT